MNILLVRVGADSTSAGGRWHGVVDVASNRFAYVPIPESLPIHPGLEKPYTDLIPILSSFGANLPTHLRSRYMHLDPDFSHLTYGDVRERAKQIRAYLANGGMIVFYSALKNIQNKGGQNLIYAIIGIFDVDKIVSANSISKFNWDTNAHSRRILTNKIDDIVVSAQPKTSGRLERCIPIGEWRDRAYRVRRELLEEWGGISGRDGYMVLSARLPRFLQPDRFRKWLDKQQPILIHKNN